MPRHCPLRGREGRPPELLSSITPRSPERLPGAGDAGPGSMPPERRPWDARSLWAHYSGHADRGRANMLDKMMAMPAETGGSLTQGRPRASEFVFARLRYESGDW